MCFPHTEVDDFLIEVQGKMVPMGENGEIDVGCGNSFGGNSTEDAVPDGVEMVCDVIETYHLQQCDMSKKEFKEYLMVYGKRIARHLKETNPERNPTYKAKMVEWVQKLVRCIKRLFSSPGRLSTLMHHPAWRWSFGKTTTQPTLRISISSRTGCSWVTLDSESKQARTQGVKCNSD